MIFWDIIVFMVSVEFLQKIITHHIIEWE